jgi:Protein of unknown function (DUF2971)
LLVTDKVYLSRLDAFNDPFEFLKSSKDSPRLVDHADSLTVGHDSVNCHSTAASLRVCALSEECRDLLMWGHYGDRHRGFCIRFEFGKDAQICEMLFPVRYEARPGPAAATQDAGTSPPSVLTKSDKWSYEQEWRILGRVPEGETDTAELFASYNPDALSGIIFGVRTPELHKTLIRTLLKERKVTFLQAEKRSNDFALQMKEIT